MNLASLLIFREDDPTQSSGAIASSPGIEGWIATFIVAVAAAFLIYDMVRRIRKVRYRDEIREEISEEEAEIEEERERAREKAQREKQD